MPAPVAAVPEPGGQGAAAHRLLQPEAQPAGGPALGPGGQHRQSGQTYSSSPAIVGGNADGDQIIVSPLILHLTRLLLLILFLALSSSNFASADICASYTPCTIDFTFLSL